MFLWSGRFVDQSKGYSPGEATQVAEIESDIGRWVNVADDIMAEQLRTSMKTHCCAQRFFPPILFFFFSSSQIQGMWTKTTTFFSPQIFFLRWKEEKMTDQDLSRRRTTVQGNANATVSDVHYITTLRRVTYFREQRHNLH